MFGHLKKRFFQGYEAAKTKAGIRGIMTQDEFDKLVRGASQSATRLQMAAMTRGQRYEYNVARLHWSLIGFLAPRKSHDEIRRVGQAALKELLAKYNPYLPEKLTS